MDVGEEALIEKTPEEKNESDEDTGNENKKVNDDLIDSETEKEISAKKVQNAEKETNYDFKSLGVCETLCEACEGLQWTTPTEVQVQAIPVALEGRDLIGLAETGSGKTGAFAIPIVQALLSSPCGLFCLVLTPTRELAIQISQQFEALGASINLKCGVIIGGMDVKAQKLVLERKPHVVIATPGRILDHLRNTKGFHLKPLKYLVLDEADRLLGGDFQQEIDDILSAIPQERNTFLFSATMTKKVAKLQRASLHNPVTLEIGKKFQTSSKLQQFMLFIPEAHKHVYLMYLLNELGEQSTIIFCNLRNQVDVVTTTLRLLGIEAIPIHGKLSQNQRSGVLNKFRSRCKTILVATDVASRGLDIPHVDVVVNLYVPSDSKQFIHRVGRTARAGRSGVAYTCVTQYDVSLFVKIEQQLGYKVPKFTAPKEEVMVLLDTVNTAHAMAELEIKEKETGVKKKGKRSWKNVNNKQDAPKKKRMRQK